MAALLRSLPDRVKREIAVQYLSAISIDIDRTLNSDAGNTPKKKAGKK